MEIFGADPPNSIVLLLPAGFFLEILRPEITGVTPRSIVGLGAPWVSDLHNSFAIAESQCVRDSEGVQVGNSQVVCSLV